MKIFITTFLSFISCVIIVSSCSKNDNINDSDYFFEVEVDGKKFRTEGVTAYGIAHTDKVNIFGANSLEFTENIYIELPENFSEGTYSFNESIFGYYIIGEDAYSSLLNGSGSVTIDYWDGFYIRGSFSFDAVNFDDESQVVKLRNGKFDVKMR